MDESTTKILDAEITGINFGLASRQEICIASISDCPISHASQLANPFLGLPLEFGKCESCGTAEPGKCEGHFGYIELPIPIYHPSHVTELKRLLSSLCLKCLKLKNSKVQSKQSSVSARLLSSCCEDASQISIKEFRTTDGSCFLQLKLPSRTRLREGFWNFLERYGYQYGDNLSRTLLPSEAMEILKRIPLDTRKKLSAKGYFPQDGYIMKYLPVPPNCLSVPEISDGVTIMSSDQSATMLKKVLKQVEIIKSSRSGTPNFESHEVEANDLQAAVEQYLEVRGTGKAARDGDARYGIHRVSNDSSTKAWLEKMRTLFIRKGSGFSSRSVITGDTYKDVNEIGIPFEVAQRITFEERVHVHNMRYLQDLVDNKLCLTYKDGSSTYSLREGSKGHTFLRTGQVVHRRIMDGDIVFINRPPTTHKHSLQALKVYIHDDHTVKINPLICGPLSADFDGDCIHLFYPQSLAAKAEVLELFSVENQLLSSHNDNLNLQLTADSLLSLKMMFKVYFFNKEEAQHLAMFAATSLPQPSVLKAPHFGSLWTALQILQTALPGSFDCYGERYLILKSELLKFDFDRDVFPGLINEILTSIFFEKGPKEVVKFFNSLVPLMMENLFSKGFSVSLEDFYIPRGVLEKIRKEIDDMSSLLFDIRTVENDLLDRQLDSNLRLVKMPLLRYILKLSALGDLIDSKSESALIKVIQQIGFLGIQLAAKGKFYSRTLVEDMDHLFEKKKPFGLNYPTARYGLIRNSFCQGLDPYEEMVHSISTREVIVRSSRGLAEPGTLFKNLMAILRDVVVCYDGTVRNVCSNSIIQFDYGVVSTKSRNLFPAGEPVGVLAATAMSNPAYKAVLDSSSSSNSSWQLMKEILQCKVNFQNDRNDRRVILYLNDCDCGQKYCQERAAYVIQNHLQKVSLKDTAVGFTIEYMRQQLLENSEPDAGLVGLIHLNQEVLNKHNLSIQDVLQKCEETINSYRRKKKVGHVFKRIMLSVSECSPCESKWAGMPCLMFSWQDASDTHLEKTSHILADMICPILLETIIKGDPRICMANIIWMSPGTSTWIRNHSKTQRGELALDIELEKAAVRQSGDAWRTVMDSCLPLIHMIDTRRSIPYAIKQVQELLGISAAFEQAVQRLSTSVTMVTKGVLKEHLILLANSMTCAGNLVGFNTGGIKALSHSLNVQAPFTEATLYTPRKCFERAAEKCHIDSLSSIVGSCSWGKHVAVGTGSRFDLLWDTKEIEKNEEPWIDVYSFLRMVRSNANGQTLSDTGLGIDIDELDEENVDHGMSPEHSSGFGKPVFEDNDLEGLLDTQVKGNDNESSWDKISKKDSAPNAGGGWAAEPSLASDANGWSGWGADTVKSQEASSERAKESFSKSAQWGDTELQKGSTESQPSGAWGKKVKEVEKPVWGQPWGKKKEEEEKSIWKKTDGQTRLEQVRGSSDWDDKAEPEPSAAWEKVKDADKSILGRPWEKKAEEADKALWKNTKQPQQQQARSSLGWGADAVKSQEVFSERVKESFSKSAQWGHTELQKGSTESEPSGAWGKKVKEVEKPVWGQPWEKKAEESDQAVWKNTNEQPKQQQARSSSGWGSAKAEGWNTSQLGQQKETLFNDGHTETESSQPATSHGWDSKKSGSWDEKHTESQWGRQRESTPKIDQTEASQARGTSNESSQPAHDWTPSAADGGSEKRTDAQWGHPGASAINSDQTEISHGWGPLKDTNQPATPHGWDSPSAGGDNEGENRNQWGQRGGSKRTRGWINSNGDEWKNKKTRPPKSPGVFHEESGASIIFTATRQRLDKFTSDEQNILSDVEPIMLSVRRIMHQSGYNDGDQLSADDQTYVIDNVFNHHPNKAEKMGAGIDHVMVNKHSTFTETKCFYIVSTDGRQEDFSTRKCVENMITEKYPDMAESFISKYFRKSQPRGDRERSVSVAPEEAGDEK